MTQQFKSYCKNFKCESLAMQIKIIFHNLKLLVTCVALLIWCFLRRFPWIFFAITFTAFLLYFTVQLGDARSERDSYSKKNAELIDSIHKLNKQKIAYEQY